MLGGGGSLFASTTVKHNKIATIALVQRMNDCCKRVVKNLKRRHMHQKTYKFILMSLLSTLVYVKKKS